MHKELRGKVCCSAVHSKAQPPKLSRHTCSVSTAACPADPFVMVLAGVYVEVCAEARGGTGGQRSPTQSMICPTTFSLPGSCTCAVHTLCG